MSSSKSFVFVKFWESECYTSNADWAYEVHFNEI